jgi:DNA polymerase I-like protein with 3'-5' exonuclease and polymerase domains
MSKVYRGPHALLDLAYDAKHYNWELVGHNLTFDLKHLFFNGLDLREKWAHDTQIMAHTLTDKVPDAYLERYEERRKQENEKLPTGFSHRTARGLSLKVLAPYHLKVKPFWEDPTNHDSDEYVLKDCEYTYRLYEHLEALLAEKEQFSFYQDKMLNWGKFLLNVELEGIYLDPQILASKELELHNQEQEFRFQLNEIWQKAHKRYYDMQVSETEARYRDMAIAAVARLKDKTKEAGTWARYQTKAREARAKIPEYINYDSPKQMLWLLKDYLRLPVTTFEGDESTGVEVLEKLAAQGHSDIKIFLKWRQVNKLLSAFLPTFKELAMNNIIHPNFNLTGTRTGRLSSSSPNMQQIPPELYTLFRPRKGNTFIGYDMAAIEGKLIAAYAQDPMLIDIILKDQSIHDYNAKIFFNLECEIKDVKKLFPNERQAAKTIGFALFYGAGSTRLKIALTSAGFPINDGRAKELHGNFKEFFKEAIQYHRDVTKAFEAGDILENSIGRPIAIQNVEDAYMKGFNTLIQSSASDLNLEAAYNAQEQFKKEGLSGKTILLVHDFIMVECKKEDAEKCNAILKQEMTKFSFDTPMGAIRLTVSGGITNEWTKD